jgi:RNA polymerase sigma factor (sigma-70 family)
MSGDTSADVHDLIEKLRHGDDSARRALLERVHHRLCRIAAATLRKQFPRLRDQHELHSVVDEAWIRLMSALKTARPESPHAFYGLMFHKVHQVLLDLATRESRNAARTRRVRAGTRTAASAAFFEPGDISGDPAQLAFWTEFHQEVASLPEPQRMVFDFHYYAEFPQVEIAQLLNLHPKQVSRLWLAATDRLARWLDGTEDLHS